MEGRIKLHRRMLENPIIMKDADHIAVWIYLLLHASHKKQKNIFRGREINIESWQLITGRRKMWQMLRISESKIERVLKLFEICSQIEQQTDSKSRLITIRNRASYQESGQQVDNKWTTSEQQVNTIQEWKNERMKEVILSPTEIQAVPDPMEDKKIDSSDQDTQGTPPPVPTPPSLPQKPTKKREDIDQLIEQLRLQAKSLRVSYDPRHERNFAKHICDTREFGEFAQSIGKTRMELAISVMRASYEINYWKGVCGWPMKIYQSYSDVYNEWVTKKKKSKEQKSFNPILKLC